LELQLGVACRKHPVRGNGLEPTGDSIQSDQPDFLPEARGPRAHLRREGYVYSQAAAA
jgi:hypothetical protein